ncbi:hypothetical protein A3K63_05235 [Candidatus Micrarchaeota archaeon RBG_16_49_10]|nr:MAG: hypothetical protein A3K63_05235 [Candidatus Micrarchaeota archaeon RBG_16_49_10]
MGESKDEFSLLAQKASNTIRLNTLELSCRDKGWLNKKVIVDGFVRDRRLWTADLFVAIRSNVLLDESENGAGKNSLIFLAEKQLKSGYIPCSRALDGSLRPLSFCLDEYTIWWILCWWDYYCMTKDEGFLKDFYGVSLKAMRYLEGKMEDGLFVQKGLRSLNWCWTLLRMGKVAYSNALLYKAMLSVAEASGILGKASEESEYLEKSSNLKARINDEMWDDAIGVYRDIGISKDYVFLDNNVICSLFGVSDKNQSRNSLEFIRKNMWTDLGTLIVDRPYKWRFSDWHKDVICPFMSYFEIEARMKMRQRKLADELITRTLGNSLARDENTVWEFWKSDGSISKKVSRCHSWSTGVLSLLSHRN